MCNVGHMKHVMSLLLLSDQEARGYDYRPKYLPHITTKGKPMI